MGHKLDSDGPTMVKKTSSAGAEGETWRPPKGTFHWKTWRKRVKISAHKYTKRERERGLQFVLHKNSNIAPANKHMLWFSKKNIS